MIIKYAEVVLSVHYCEKNENGAREALASILWVVNNIPEKQYRYKDLAEYTLDFYRKCLRQTLSAGIELDSSYFTVRGELLCIE